METKLRPCPFCGGEARLYGVDEPRGVVWIECKACKCSGTFFDTAEEAIQTWNQRNGAVSVLTGTVPEETEMWSKVPDSWKEHTMERFTKEERI